ncbi:MAG: STAS-like domain-containing protein [Patescibacteria group bacterium]|jgi:hypothetical protein
MRIELKRFGTTLVSRPAGKDSYLAHRAAMSKLAVDEEIIFDFAGVDVLTPSWADEFITPFVKQYPNQIKFEHTDNLSIRVTLDILRQVWSGAEDLE